VLKTVGYLISTLSVVLLAIPSWRSATAHPLLLLALIAGVSTSILGMVLRWLAYVRERSKRG